MRRGLPLNVLLLLISACAKPAAAPPNTDEARASLRQADSAYSAAGHAKDRAAFVAAYTADAMMYPPGAATLSGREAIDKFLEGVFADSAFSATFRPLDVQVSTDGTMGYTLNEADLTSTGPDKKITTERVRDFHVWKREADGSWKLGIDIWNIGPAAAAAGN
jgi:uncharacterized protein (TIGR02246 family)